jgi:uncharacterized membrane protein YfcA
VWDVNFAVTALGIALIAWVAGVIHSAVGFGFGLVALAVVPLITDIKSAHVIISLASVPMIMATSWSYRRGIDWQTLWPALVGAGLFLPLGLRAFEVVPLAWLVRGTGLAILVMVWMSTRSTSEAGSPGRTGWLCFAAGAASGFLAGAVSIAGPPIAAFALKQDWDQLRFKAFVTQCLLVIAVYKAVLLWMRDLVTAEQASQAAIAAPLAILGVYLGVRLSGRFAADRFKRLVAFALTLVACLMLYRG